MVLTLYKTDASPPARSALMVIELLNLPVQFVDKNLIKGEHLTEEFKNMNPQHTVPTLIDDDFIIADSHAISTYLISKYGKDDSLYPTDPKVRAVVDQRLHFDSGILFPAVKSLFSPVLFAGVTKITDEVINKIKSAYDLTNKFATKKWLAGDQFTVADICCVTSISSLHEIFSIDAEKYPNLHAWYKRCSELEIYQKKNAPGNKELGKAFRAILGL